MPGTSIIIPTLNEAKTLERTLNHLAILNPTPEEIIIVDGGSQDATLNIAQASNLKNLKLITSPQPGRSIQMNLGAAQAKGEYLCFLHADTLVPDDLVAVICEILAQPQIAGIGFISLMTGSQITRWGISLHNYLKTYYAPFLFRPYLFWWRGLRLLFGDQVICCRRSQFQACGGYDPTLPIMEEADLCLKLTQFGAIKQVNRIVVSSDRRVAAWGAWKATGIYLGIGVLWGLGVSANTLKKFYQDVR
ncbi:TIGR04283 family arsenosugar biosynthesis glycosyltransferase [Thermosynechococcaceae cyanobacterium BACA0444]|uniref:4,4'-diaponeurosporenoate glycosyltransferase n=1 Tax=Pseudocalidococcus azoricus BACA0444 TaxID=2918990 RepID=A0AAE4FSM7_9CYAN|nr:TIGR04283 family arsenosugar biosynthesis glycosyltransferase [Pseudocalidococcus azoricus]MDS3861376.1 TIGR04283 family arsenosugar biosynthesis glycosyltransferase [Pseudocalidococcus azoricus BACA0444]